MPWVHAKVSYSWAFGVPGIAMSLATLVFWLGTKYYVLQPPAQEDRLHPVAVIWCAVRHGRKRKRGEPFLDVARRWYAAEEVEGTKAVLGILGMFATVPVFWALFIQPGVGADEEHHHELLADDDCGRALPGGAVHQPE